MPRIELELGTYCPDRRALLLDGGERGLTTTEARLLQYLAARPDVGVSHRELLREVWGYKDGVESRTLYAAIRRLRAKVEADPTAPRHIVPVPGMGYRFVPLEAEGGGLVGRREALAALLRRLDQGARLLTLLGPGGVGKSSLARALLQRREGVFVPLAHVHQPEELFAALRAALRLPASADPEGQLRSALAARGGRPVVLDNLEQLLPGAAERVAGWAGPGAPLVLTSRVPLQVPGEERFAVEALDPDSAVTLFLRRATGLRPDFAPSEAGRREIRRLAEALDGLPLAIELAAGRVDRIGPGALLEAGPFELLHRRGGAGEARHDSLRGALDWSWDLLSADQRAVLADLSVFAGHFDAGAARAVARPPRRGATLDALAALVDASLVVARPLPGAPEELRFHLLETVRVWAAGKEPDPGARDRHLAWFAARATPEHLDDAALSGPTAIGRALPWELPDLRAALAHAQACGDGEAEARCAALVAAAWHRDRPADSLAVAEAALARCPAGGTAAALLLHQRARVGFVLGAPGLDAWLAEAEAAARAHGLDGALRNLQRMRGYRLGIGGRRAEGEALLRAVRQRCEDAGDLAGRGASSHSLGVLRQQAGANDEALLHFQAALADAERAGEPMLRNRAHGSLGVTLRQLGRFEEARTQYRQAIEACADPGTIALYHRFNLALLERAAGRIEAARDSLAELRALALRAGVLPLATAARPPKCQASSACSQRAAVALLEGALAEPAELSILPLQRMARLWLGLHRGEDLGALEAAVAPPPGTSPRAAAMIWAALARAHLGAGGLDAAAALLGRCGPSGDALFDADVDAARAALDLARGDAPRALAGAAACLSVLAPAPGLLLESGVLPVQLRAARACGEPAEAARAAALLRAWAGVVGASDAMRGWLGLLAGEGADA